MATSQYFDVAIIGGGIAGLSTALRLSREARVVLFTKGQLGESNTRYAQGGLAVALGDDDNPALHLQDTLAAGAGLCDEDAVRMLVEQAPAAARWLMQMGVQFDRIEPGSDAHATSDGLLLGREAAHSRWRVLHAGGDATGAEIERALLAALRQRTSITVYEETFVSRLLVEDGRCIGLEATDNHGQTFVVEAQSTVLANGGAGGLWLHTSNPAGATADGLALAWQAGAALTDLEFMQFHPTVLVVGGTSHLISEAVRGEGAYLRNHKGERFMPRYAEQAELAPRDVVARAILSEMLAEQTDCQYLDLRHLPAEKMYARFPTISAICASYGLDLARDLLPVAPAAHYCMGGVSVDTEGRTTVPGLYAVGEVACTGVHGANRLASNSLLEGLVFGLRVADTLNSNTQQRPSSSTHRMMLIPLPSVGAGLPQPTPDSLGRPGHADESAMGCGKPAPTGVLCRLNLTPIGEAKPSPLRISDEQHIRRELRNIMWQYVSLCRDETGLLEAKERIHALQQSLFRASNENNQRASGWQETANMLLVAQLVIAAALQRRESRGSHWRLDYESLDEALTGFHYAFVREAISNAPHIQEEVAVHA